MSHGKITEKFIIFERYSLFEQKNCPKKTEQLSFFHRNAEHYIPFIALAGGGVHARVRSRNSTGRGSIFFLIQIELQLFKR